MINWVKRLFGYDRTFGVKRSPDWKVTRKIFLTVYDKCAVCGTKKKLEVHHLIPVNKDISKENDMYNLITLCREHHFTFGHLCSWYSFNENVKDDAKLWKTKIENRP